MKQRLLKPRMMAKMMACQIKTGTRKVLKEKMVGHLRVAHSQSQTSGDLHHFWMKSTHNWMSSPYLPVMAARAKTLTGQNTDDSVETLRAVDYRLVSVPTMHLLPIQGDDKARVGRVRVQGEVS